MSSLHLLEGSKEGKHPGYISLKGSRERKYPVYICWRGAKRENILVTSP
jgi:hypothetical protein